MTAVCRGGQHFTAPGATMCACGGITRVPAARDGEVCECRCAPDCPRCLERNDHARWCPTGRLGNDCSPHGPFCDPTCPGYRPLLSEPPAETQQDDERVAVWRIATRYADPEMARFAINDFRDWLAARPSADTETLRRVRELIEAAEGRSRSWSEHSRQRFEPALSVVALRAALDGEQRG